MAVMDYSMKATNELIPRPLLLQSNAVNLRA